jgi:hypothetical protein
LLYVNDDPTLKPKAGAGISPQFTTTEGGYIKESTKRWNSLPEHCRTPVTLEKIRSSLNNSSFE